MPEFSELLRQRLALSELSDGHPDADTLTAYMEQLLSPVERRRVLEHVGSCRECRDVITLSREVIPAGPDIRVLQLPSKSKRRIWAPVFGLSAACAVMAVIAIVVVKQPQTKQTAQVEQPPQAQIALPASTPAAVPNEAQILPNQETSNHSASSGESISRARQPERRTLDSISLADRTTASLAPPIIISANQAPVAAITQSVETKPRHDYVNSNLFRAQDTFSPGQDSNTASDSSTVAGQHSSSSQFGNAFVAGNQLTIADLPPGATTSKVIQSWRPSSTQTGHRLPLLVGDLKHRVVELMGKRPPLAITALGSNTMSGPEFNPARDKTQSMEIASTAADASNDSSELQQSPSFTRRAMTPGAVRTLDIRPQAAWAIGNGKLLKTDETGAWVSGYTGTESIEFSTVNARGADVWAGGNHAVLLHSHDGGTTWERIRLGDSATGNITAISAMGQSLTVMTSENQTWSSQDAGKTWVRN